LRLVDAPTSDTRARSESPGLLESAGTPETPRSVDSVESSVYAFALAIAEADQAEIEAMLDTMGIAELRELAIQLARRISLPDPSGSGDSGDPTATVQAQPPSDLGPDGICEFAVNAAAQAFGTTPAAILSADRHRNITDARAVAMTAAREGGMTLHGIGAVFVKNHTMVLYNQAKVSQSPRLRAAVDRIVAELEAHYAAPDSSADGSARSSTGAPATPAGLGAPAPVPAMNRWARSNRRAAAAQQAVDTATPATATATATAGASEAAAQPAQTAPVLRASGEVQQGRSSLLQLAALDEARRAQIARSPEESSVGFGTERDGVSYAPVSPRESRAAGTAR